MLVSWHQIFVFFVIWVTGSDAMVFFYYFFHPALSEYSDPSAGGIFPDLVVRLSPVTYRILLPEKVLYVYA